MVVEGEGQATGVDRLESVCVCVGGGQEKPEIERVNCC